MNISEAIRARIIEPREIEFLGETRQFTPLSAAKMAALEAAMPPPSPPPVPDVRADGSRGVRPNHDDPNHRRAVVAWTQRFEAAVIAAALDMSNSAGGMSFSVCWRIPEQLKTWATAVVDVLTDTCTRPEIIAAVETIERATKPNRKLLRESLIREAPPDGDTAPDDFPKRAELPEHYFALAACAAFGQPPEWLDNLDPYDRERMIEFAAVQFRMAQQQHAAMVELVAALAGAGAVRAAAGGS